jgi:hypothetical protein
MERKDWSARIEKGGQREPKKGTGVEVVASESHEEDKKHERQYKRNVINPHSKKKGNRPFNLSRG